MANPASLVIPHIIEQHVEEAGFLWRQRSNAVNEPHYDLNDLVKLDDRVAAHLDGIVVAGEYAVGVCDATLENAGLGEIFTATVRAIVDKDQNRLDNLIALVEAAPEFLPGLYSAFGWVSAPYLQGIVAALLSSKQPLKQQVGIVACVMHRVDPGIALTETIASEEPMLRARAFRAAGELGRRDLLEMCINGLQDTNVVCRFWAGWSAILLGERDKALSVLNDIVLSFNAFRQHAMHLVLKVLSLPNAQQLLKTIAQEPSNKRLLIQGAGISGDVQYLPWLINQMDDEQSSRLAGESFSLITGLDLAYLDLERDSPSDKNIDSNEDPEDEKIVVDSDDNLPWPDPVKLQAWWDINKSGFTQGTRYFMGAAVTREHCIQVLKIGYQRQRFAAAQYLCALKPGTSLFPVSAPGWRQKRWLAKLF